MDIFPGEPAVAKYPQSAARRHWGQADSLIVVIQALLPHHNLRNVSPRMRAVQALGRHTRQVLAGLRGTR